MDEHGIKRLTPNELLTPNGLLTPDALLTPDGLYQFLSCQSLATEFIIAYSGGMDSHVLLDLMATTQKCYPNLKISALHIHHGLSPDADHWAKHCELVCATLQIPLTVLWVHVNLTEGRSPEEVAREARFHAFSQYLKPNECLVLAHHAEDQAETILLRLFRGTGPEGLAGMSQKIILEKGEVLRPFLDVSKQDIIHYAKSKNLVWIEDESNRNLRFDRNFLREEIIPRLSARWPRVVRAVSRAGALCLETTTAVQILAKQDYEEVQGTEINSLSVIKLNALDLVRRRGVIRYWLKQLECMPPSHDHMERIDKEILNAKPDKHPRLKLGDYEVQRHKKNLVVVKVLEPVKKQIMKRRNSSPSTL